MRAALHLAARSVTVDDVDDPRIQQPTDAVVRVLRSCVCGSDLWAYRGTFDRAPRSRMGHEFLGIIESIGADVADLRVGDLVISPFNWADGSCPACAEGLYTSCDNAGYWAQPGSDGGQGEAVRVPWADATLVAVPGGLAAVGDELLPALLTLSDVTATGLHGAIMAGVGQGSTMAVVGDGAVGLCAVLTARVVLGAERVILLSRNPARQAIGRAFGATDIVAVRGEEALVAVRELTEGLGVPHVVEAVGTPDAWTTAIQIARDGGQIGSVGVPHTTPTLDLGPVFGRNLGIRAGVCSARKYLPDLLRRVTSGELNPAAVFDLTLPLEAASDAYVAMDARTAVKVMLIP